jgi:hypothetical protein
LRSQLAEIEGVSPFFLENRETVLPLGLGRNGLQFFGGRFYNESNGFLGSDAGKAQIFGYLEGIGKPFRLLSFDQDPIHHLGDNIRWDVPFNQCWVLEPGSTFETYLTQFSAGEQKDIRYLQRRFFNAAIVTAVSNLDVAWRQIDEFMIYTAEAFQKRGRKSVNNDHAYRAAAKAVVSRPLKMENLVTRWDWESL